MSMADEVQFHAGIWFVAALSESGIKGHTWLISLVPVEQRWNVIFETHDSSEVFL